MSSGIPNALPTVDTGKDSIDEERLGKVGIGRGSIQTLGVEATKWGRAFGKRAKKIPHSREVNVDETVTRA